MAAEYFIENASVRITMPGVLEPYEFCEELYPRQPTPEIRSMLELRFMNTELKDVEVCLPNGAKVKIPRLRIDSLRGTMIPTLDESGRVMFFDLVKPDAIVEGKKDESETRQDSNQRELL